ncbi:zinc-binding dehydrogenase [Kutzneria sp. NPDC052558]|uniref:zinc-binding dehydrogenase n=1 Tax=Kutzneria sp. NPDC052558 TaxID=3364121 RepID=UPI0037C69991
MSATMPAGRLNLRTLEFAVEEVPVPTPGPGEVLVKVEAAGVCLSDIHLIDGTLRLPGNELEKVTLGHEVAGTIAELGEGVPDVFAEGQRVLLLAGMACGKCANCVRRRPGCLHGLTRGIEFDGGWAPYTLARFETVYPIPDSLPIEQAAIIPDAVSTPYAAITHTAALRPAQSAGIWGIGGLGAHGVQLLRFAGAAPIIAVDPLPSARERALKFGADIALDPLSADFRQQVLAATDGRGLDYAFDFAGVPAVRTQADSVLAREGSLVLVGLSGQALSIPNDTAFSAGRHRILGHYGGLPVHLEELIKLAGHGRLDFSASISGRLKFDDAAEAVRQLAEKVNDPIRLVLTPDGV